MLICEGLYAGDHRSPTARAMQTQSGIFNNFMAFPGQFGVAQIFIFALAREQVTSKVCYQDEVGKTVYQ